MFLLNIQPFLSENLTKISTILKNYALATYNTEQSKCSERAQRLTSGQPNTQAQRSLANLTGETNIYAELHTHFTWILWAGARCLTESLTLGSSIPLQIYTHHLIKPTPFIQVVQRCRHLSVAIQRKDFL